MCGAVTHCDGEAACTQAGMPGLGQPGWIPSQVWLSWGVELRVEIPGTLNCLQTDGHKKGRACLWRKGQHRLCMVLGSFRLAVSGGEGPDFLPTAPRV